MKRDSGARPACAAGLSALLGWARTALPAGSSLTLTLGDPRAPQHSLTHDARGQAADGAQWQAAEGPVLTTFTSQVTTTSTDLATDARWPCLQAALGATTLGVLATPICWDHDVVGVLSLYSVDPIILSSDKVHSRADLVASAAALVVAVEDRAQRAEREAAQLGDALVSRAVIEQAKGIVCAHLNIAAEDAFGVLSQVSQDHNVKLHRLAAVLVDQPADQEMVALLRRTAARWGLLPQTASPQMGSTARPGAPPSR